MRDISNSLAKCCGTKLRCVPTAQFLDGVEPNTSDKRNLQHMQQYFNSKMQMASRVMFKLPVQIY